MGTPKYQTTQYTLPSSTNVHIPLYLWPNINKHLEILKLDNKKMQDILENSSLEASTANSQHTLWKPYK